MHEPHMPREGPLYARHQRLSSFFDFSWWEKLAATLIRSLGTTHQKEHRVGRSCVCYTNLRQSPSQTTAITRHGNFRMHIQIQISHVRSSMKMTMGSIDIHIPKGLKHPSWPPSNPTERRSNVPSPPTDAASRVTSTWWDRLPFTILDELTSVAVTPKSGYHGPLLPFGSC